TRKCLEHSCDGRKIEVLDGLADHGAGSCRRSVLWQIRVEPLELRHLSPRAPPLVGASCLSKVRAGRTVHAQHEVEPPGEFARESFVLHEASVNAAGAN